MACRWPLSPRHAGLPTPLAPLHPPSTPGKLAPDGGVREVGETAAIGYFTQHPPPVDPSLRLVDYVRGVLATFELAARLVCACCRPCARAAPLPVRLLPARRA